MSYSYLPDVSTEDTESDMPHNYPPTAPSISPITTSKRSWIERLLPSVDPAQRTAQLLAVSGLAFTLLSGVAFVTIGITIYFVSPSLALGKAFEAAGVATATNNVTQVDPLVQWLLYKGADPRTERTIFIPVGNTANIALSLFFNALVTVCTEATGYVHGTSLKWALAEEDRLRFNANLRLFTASKGAFSVSGPVVNGLYGLTTVLAYAASSSFLLRLSALMWLPQGLYTIPHLTYSATSFVPPIVLGLALVTQAALGLVAVYRIPVLTWSSSPLDITPALVSHGRIHHRPKRCLRSISTKDDLTDDPIRPSPCQPSAWGSHKAVTWVVYAVWGVAVAWLTAGVIWGRSLVERGYVDAWGPNQVMEMYWLGVAPSGPLLLQSLLIGAMQSVVTVGIHSCELVTTLARDEVVWRKAASKKGARPTGNALKVLLGSWQSAGLLVAKPVIHWVFGLAVSLQAGNGFSIAPQYMLGLGGAMVVLATLITFIATRRPSGPQPAAYGHIQTLADLVDEWSTTMYWGHKGNREDGPWPVCHAGTTDEGVLPPVKMDEVYA